MNPPTIRLTLRTLLAYLDDTLDPAQALVIGEKLSESKAAQELAERIRKITRKRGLSVPSAAEGQGTSSDPNTVAGYLSDSLPPEQLAEFEQICLESDVHLAEVAASHQILTLVLSEQVRIPPTAYRRMYGLVQGAASDPTRKPTTALALGTAADAAPHAADDLDTTYLLGMSAYSNTQPLKKRVLQGVAAGLLLAGFLVAAYLAWPVTTDKGVAKRGDSVAPSTAVTKATEPAPVLPPPATKPVTPQPPIDTEPVRPPGEPIPPKDVEPKTPATDPKKPPVEPKANPAPAAAANWDVLPGRVGVAACDGPDDQLLLALQDGGAAMAWRRVPPKGEVMTTDRLMALPGYRPKLTYETGLTVELWANMPELVALPVLQTSVTPTVAAAGYDADLTLHVGRLFLGTTKAGGAKVRLRIANQVWDIGLTDARSVVVVEVLHPPTAGAQPANPVTFAVLSATAGGAMFSTKEREAVRVPVGQIVVWSNQGGGVQGPKAADSAKFEPTPEYFERIPVYRDEATAVAARKSLETFAKRFPDARSLASLLAETDTGVAKGTTAADVHGARFAILAAGAVGEYPRLVDAINDPDRPFARDAGLTALRTALGNDPTAEAAFRAAATAKFPLEKPALEAWIARLRGLTPAEQRDPATYDQLADDLSAPALVSRELAFHVLINFVDPDARRQDILARYNAGAPADVREASMKAWRKRVTDMKAMMKAAPAMP